MIRVACVLQRNPVVQRAPTAFEEAYRAYRSHAQSATARATFDIVTAHKRELAKFDGGSATDAASASDHPAAPDHSGAYADLDRADPRRCIDRKLYFAVRDERGQWLFPWHPREVTDATTEGFPIAFPVDPQTQMPKGSPLHRTAEGVVRSLLGTDWQTYLPGRVPVAWMGSSAESKGVGIREPTFFFRAHVVGGQMAWRPNAAFQDYAWCTRDELRNLFDPSYYSPVSRILSD